MAKEVKQGKQGIGWGRHARGKVNWEMQRQWQWEIDLVVPFLGLANLLSSDEEIRRSEWIVVRGEEGEEDGNPGPSLI